MEEASFRNNGLHCDQETRAQSFGATAEKTQYPELTGILDGTTFLDSREEDVTKNHTIPAEASNSLYSNLQDSLSKLQVIHINC